MRTTLTATLYTNATGTHKDEHAQKPEQSTRVGAGPAPLPPLVAAADAADAGARMMLAVYDGCCRCSLPSLLPLLPVPYCR